MTRKIEQVRFAESAPKKKRVAAYARVSSGKDAMLHSLSAQVSYYSDYIQNNGWEYVGVYADKAITGTKDKREGFQKLLAECRNSNVDMVITKSISRFARNTVTLLTTVRKLKELGVDVYFEEQNIHTTSADGELRRRKESSRRTTSQSPFSGRVFCGDCGEQFGPKVWHSNGQYRRLIWQCNHKFKGAEKCTTPHLTEDALKEYTRQALSFLIENREALIEDGRLIKQALFDHTEIDAELRAVAEEMEVVAGLIEKSIAANAITALDQGEYAKTYESLTERYQALQKRYTTLTRQREDKQFKADELSGFLFEIGELDLLDTEWKDSRFRAIVERITVYNDGRLVFAFTNGSEETVMM